MGYQGSLFPMDGKGIVGYTPWGSPSAAYLEHQWMRNVSLKTSRHRYRNPRLSNSTPLLITGASDRPKTLEEKPKERDSVLNEVFLHLRERRKKAWGGPNSIEPDQWNDDRRWLWEGDERERGGPQRSRLDSCSGCSIVALGHGPWLQWHMVLSWLHIPVKKKKEKINICLTNYGNFIAIFLTRKDSIWELIWRCFSC